MKGSSLVHHLIIVGFFFLFFAISCLNALSHAGLVKSLPDIKDSRSSMGVLPHTLQLRITKIIFIISVTAMFTGITGSSMRPVVTISPSWNKILSGDSITMTCDVDDAVEGSITYTWYWNNRWINTGKTFTIQTAQSWHNGDYQCRTSKDNISEAATLSVTEGPVVLQSPPYIYEGDYLTLRCHSRSRDSRGPIVFYRNNEIIYTSNNDPEIQLRNHRDETAVYKCTKQVLTTQYSEYSDETDVTAQGDSSSSRMTFTPNWKKIFTGENMTMSCNVNHYGAYYWYKDNKLLKQTNQNFIDIRSAQRGDSGRYHCRTSSGHSPEVRLDVSDGPVILQAPLYVYYGYTTYLRCRSRPEYSVDWTRFYKDDKLLQGSGDEGLYLRRGDMYGRYRCEKRIRVSNYHVPYMDSVSVPIRDLFSSPKINLTRSVTTEGDSLTRSVTTEGDHLTLTCDTRLSPHRRTTELLYAFYRDGQEVQRFNTSNKYEVLSAKLEDSGNYSCTARTLDGRVLKTSQELHVQIGNLFSSPEINLTWSVTTEDDSRTRSVTTEGDHLTLTCDTRLSPHRRTTELLYAFYRDGQEVQGFSPSNKYEVLSAKLEDSGNYSCTARTFDNYVCKKSPELNVQIYKMDGHGHITYLTVLLTLLIILIVSALLIFRHRHQVARLLPKRNRMRDPQPVRSSAVEENCYMEVAISQNASATDVTGADDVCYTTLSRHARALSHGVAETVVYSEIRTMGRDP